MHFARYALRRFLKRDLPRRPTPRVRLRVETLEDRLVPSADFLQTNLISDVPGLAQVTDPNAVNTWGLTASPTSPFWVANQGTGTSTLYNTSQPQVQIVSLVVGIPANPADNPMLPHGSPTGDVFNIAGSGFNVTENGNTGSSIFLFATTDGTISGWSPRVDGTHALIGATNPGAVYTGLAIGTDSSGATLLYAANFAKNTIDVYDQSFALVKTLPGNFTDSQLPDNYRVFNVQAINNQLYVEYAPFDPSTGGVAPGHAHGAVDIYNTDGQLQQRLLRHGHLDDPWGVAVAPANFGRFSNAVLVGNFGDGNINAFDPRDGDFLGEMKGADGEPITIQHLWALRFGNGAAGGPTNTLFFTAGLTSHFGGTSNLPPHGLFGSLQVAPESGHDGMDGDGDSHDGFDMGLVAMPPSLIHPKSGGQDQQTGANSSTATGTPGAVASEQPTLEQQVDTFFGTFHAPQASQASRLDAMGSQLFGFGSTFNPDLFALNAMNVSDS